LNSADYSPRAASGQATSAAAASGTASRLVSWAIAILGFALGATALLDMDFHWHLALGQRLLAEGFPQVEPFSHLPAGVPDRQAWLADAAFAVLDRIGGVWLVRAACGAAFAAACASVWRLAGRRTRSVGLALVPVAAFMALAVARLRVRPDLFTLALVPPFVELLERPAGWRRLVAVAIVSALWANLHPGSLIAGLLAIAQLWPPTLPRLATAAAACGGLCATPDGVRGLLRYTADTTALRPLIPEWQRLWERPFAELRAEWWIAGGVALLVAAALAARLRGVRRAGATDAPGEDVREAARGILGGALAASAVRFLFALVLPALWGVRALAPIVERRRGLAAAASLASLAAFAALPLPHVAGVVEGVRHAGAGFLGAEPPGFPVEAAGFLRASGLSGNLAHPARWGGYLAWKLDGRFKTATDGRVTHFGPTVAREWSEGVDSATREEIFERRGIDLLVIPAEMFPPLRHDVRYQPLHVDPLAVVLLRVDGPGAAANVATIQRAARGR
jgi:hypothetical protein